MSHDRGCPCGRERWDYDSCTDPKCTRRKKSATVVRLGPRNGPCENGKTKVFKKCRLTGRYQVNGKILCARHAGTFLLKEMLR